MLFFDRKATEVSTCVSNLKTTLMQRYKIGTVGYKSWMTASLLIILLGFIGCQKELSETGGPIFPPTSNYDLTSRISTTISGFVTDETNAPMMNATVQVGGATTTTDDYGYFEVKNVSVVKNAAVVRVEKTGYFPGIKTLIVATNKAGFVRVKMIRKQSAGTLNGASGGTVSLLNGLRITLPANGIVNAATNAPYTGAITVNAFWIDPSASDLGLTMPGDLRGVRSSGTVQTLTTYGMVAVELNGSAGEKLQIASGFTARLVVPLPTALQSTAPATIPLWHFNETTGLWEEEGTATKNGNQYEGDVSHFSFWNCDVPANFVQFNCTVVDGANAPVRQAMVKISRASNPYDYRIGFTDSLGYVSGAVPANTNLILEVFSSNTCGSAAVSQNFSTTTADVNLGNISIPAANLGNLVGNVISCTATPVTSGYVIINQGGVLYRYPISSTGTFTAQVTICPSNTTATILAEDLNNSQQSTPQTITLVAGNNNVGTLTACGVSIAEFINYTINGTPYALSTNSVFVQNILGGAGTTLPATALQQIYASGVNTQSIQASLTFTNQGIALNSVQELRSFQAQQLSDSSSITTPINVNITEYGAVGEFIAGNFTGNLTGAPPTNTIYSITCNFRVRRRL